MKKWISVLSVIVIAAILLVGCGNLSKLSRIDVGSVNHVTISDDSNSDGPKNDIIRRKGITELVEMYNSAEYSVTDKVKAEDLKKEQVRYHFCFYSFDEALIGECTMYPGGYLMLPDDPDTVYLLKDGFDEDAVKEVIRLYDIRSRVP